jgi:molecular chaperone DnaK (HSP70)
MRKVILDMLVTLDGFFEGPNGELDWTFVVWDEEFQKYSNNELRSMDAILYGRVAYQKTGHQNVDELGPETESTIEFVNNVNNIKKVVFSRTLEKVEDNAILIKEINAKYRDEKRAQSHLSIPNTKIISKYCCTSFMMFL